MIKDLNLNKIEVKGISKLREKPEEFIGYIGLDKKENGIYFTWKLETVNGEFLGMKGDLIPNKIIPLNKNEREFVIEYAIKSTEIYRVSRKRLFEVIEYIDEE